METEIGNTGKILRLLAITVALAVIGCSGDGSDGPVYDGSDESEGSVSAELGQRSVGDSWTYQYSTDGIPGITSTVTIREEREHRGRQVLVVETTGGETTAIWWDVETGNAIAHLDAGEIDTEYRPHDGQFSFPLKVGKTWHAEYEQSYPGIPDSSESRWVDREVKAYEEVTVPADTFSAFRVVVTDAKDDSDKGETYWYSSEVNSIVKLQYEFESGSTLVVELVDYDL